MSVASWYPWNEHVAPGLQLSWIYQYLAGALSVTATLYPGLVAVSHILHVYTQFKVLGKNLVAITDLDSERRLAALKRCIDHHTVILDYGGETQLYKSSRSCKCLIIIVGKLEIFFNIVNYAQQMIMAVQISCVGYKLLEMVLLTGMDPLNFVRYLMEWLALQV